MSIGWPKYSVLLKINGQLSYILHFNFFITVKHVGNAGFVHICLDTGFIQKHTVLYF